MTDYVIRSATPADAAGIAGCVDRAYDHYIERIGKKPGPMLDDYTQVVREHSVYVAESSSGIVGVLVLMSTEEGLLLDNIAVDPNTQGSGLGQTMLSLAEREAQNRGYDGIYLYTHELMTENIPYYEKRGYIEYERKTVRGYARIYMRKQLV